MAEAAEAVVVAVQVIAPNAAQKTANAQNVPHAESALSVVTAMERTVKAEAHAKTVTASVVVNPATLKGKPRLTTTPHPKPKPKHALKRVTNAWRAKNAGSQPKAVKAVANVAHAASATKVAVNARPA